MRRIVIDCDPGIDDAQAIMMAYQYPGVKIEAITTVAGNVGVEHTSENALKILDALEADPIPVFAGAQTALVERGNRAAHVHGEDGLGDAGIPETQRHLEAEHAALALIRLGKENPGELELIAIGPLTNLALALRLDPDLPSRYKRLVVMGGAYLAQGNTPNFPVEFNFYADPDAAAVVFDNWPMVTLVTWEATLAHGIDLAQYDELMRFENGRSRFLKKITRKLEIFMKEVFRRDLSYLADALAMAVLLEEGIVLEAEKKYVQIERSGVLTRGMTVVDWSDHSKKPPNALIITKVDHDRFVALLRAAFE
jgi:purine nucleosidase